MKYLTELIGTITPTDVRIFYEDGKPYMEYTGISYIENARVQVHIPKMDLVLNNITKEEETVETYGYNQLGTKPISFEVTLSQKIYTQKDDVWIEVKLLERNMTKEQIEKELGYKVNIKE